MPKHRVDQRIVRLDTMRDILRDLHNAHMALIFEPDEDDYCREYFTCFTLLWQCIVGEPMHVADAQHIFGISDDEWREYRNEGS